MYVCTDLGYDTGGESSTLQRWYYTIIYYHRDGGARSPYCNTDLGYVIGGESSTLVCVYWWWYYLLCYDGGRPCIA